MSNGLWTTCLALAETTSAPTSQPVEDQPFPRGGVVLIILGILMLMVWIIRRLRNPSVLKLQRTPARENSLNPLHFLAVFVTFYLLSFLLFQLFQKLFPDASEFSALLPATLIGQAVTVVLSLLIGHFCFALGMQGGLGLNTRHVGFDAIRGVLTCLAIYPVCLGLVLVLQTILEQWAPQLITPHTFLEEFHNASGLVKTGIVISAVVLAPLSEELLFRGLLQSMLRRVFGPWTAILIASLAFTLVHAQYQNLLGLFALSAILGYSYERTGRLLAPILTHALFNAINILLLL